MVAKSGSLFLTRTDAEATHMYRWTLGNGWEDLGVLLGGHDVEAVCIQGSYLYIAGSFTMLMPGNTYATNIAKFNYVTDTWSPVGDGSFDSTIYAVAVDSNGKVYIGAEDTGGNHGANLVTGLFKYWNGSAWATLGSGMYGRSAGIYGRAMINGLVADGTDIYAVGHFDAGVNGDSSRVNSTNIIKWDGSSWHAMGTPTGYGIVVGLTSEPDFRKIAVSGTNVFVTGGFKNDDGNGGVIPPMGLDRFSVNCSHVQAFSLLDGFQGNATYGLDVSARNGIVYLAGGFNYIDSTAVTGVAQWSGSSWSALGSGVDASCDAAAADLDTCLPGNYVFVLGEFTHAGGQTVSNPAYPYPVPISWIPGTTGPECNE